MLIDTDAIQVHYEQAQNIVGSSSQTTMRRMEYLTHVNISNSLYHGRWGGQGVFHVREQNIFLYHQGEFQQQLDHAFCLMKDHRVGATFMCFVRVVRHNFPRRNQLAKCLIAAPP
jgi:hypothetical protein